MNDEELPRYSTTSGKVVRSQNTGRWTDELTGEKYVFSCSLREEPDFSYGNTARSIFVQLLRETALQQQQEEIGYLNGILLRRPSSDFFEVADAISSELKKISVYFCESDGKATRVRHPKLKDQSPMAVSGGGFFHVYEVEVKPEYQGRDLGLRLVHEAFIFLGEEWTLAVMMPGAINSSFRKWTDAKVIEGNKAAAGSKLGIYFTRMGFSQAAATRKGCSYWFLTREVYGESTDEAMERWISKECSSQIEIYTPPPLSNPTGLDGELQAEIVKAIKSRNLSRVEDLVQRGASIDSSFAIHIAVVNPDQSSSNPILSKLIELGGDVNFPDDHGNRPVHSAAMKCNARYITVLIAAGADALAQNSDGQTAIDLVRSQAHEVGDDPSCSCISTDVREFDVIPPYETIIALMTTEEKAKLVDGWMPPRLFFLMKEVASSEIDDLLDTPELGYSPRLAFIPPTVLSNYQGEYYSCLEAFSLAETSNY